MELITIVQKVKKYWQEQKIMTTGISVEQIDEICLQKGIILPPEFHVFYQELNGMTNLFPNDFDKEGYLFYPIQKIDFVPNILANPANNSSYVKDCIVFADYMHCSWWYVFRYSADGTLIVGLDDGIQFNPITDSFATFLDLYLNDDTRLYPSASHNK